MEVCIKDHAGICKIPKQVPETSYYALCFIGVLLGTSTIIMMNRKSINLLPILNPIFTILAMGFLYTYDTLAQKSFTEALSYSILITNGLILIFRLSVGQRKFIEAVNHFVNVYVFLRLAYIYSNPGFEGDTKAPLY